ncbi:glycosyltransferase family A protein [Hoeflea sp.]|uniref:glycosyltransferase family A protein n=1 Tax=Hoeflea sp. TaxID=1940281 RepID=UPI002AFFCB5C|nr:glycosyltransferase family A protein [Hoeflea sp.]
MIQLSICLPTRNRQKYCIETIRALAQSEVTNFEVIVGDNSDDASVLSGFFSDDFQDPRFRLIGPEDRVLPMVDNWERLVGETKGRWLCVIGDDDYIDPKLVLLLKYYERIYPDADAVSWDRMNFNWPDNRQLPSLSVVPVTHKTYIIKRQESKERLFLWSEGKSRPSSGYGIYHGALRRSLLRRIKRKFGNRYFEHPNVDFDSTCKTIHEARLLVHCCRPFSVLGACIASNSAATKSREILVERVKTFAAESQGTIDIDTPVFPFPINDPGASICSSIASTTSWFCRTYGIDQTGFPENFARSAMDECHTTVLEDDFNCKVAYFQRGFDLWDGGKWRDCFKPKPFQMKSSVNEACGVIGRNLYIREDTTPAQTPAEFYHFAEKAIMPIKYVTADTKVFAT